MIKILFVLLFSMGLGVVPAQAQCSGTFNAGQVCGSNSSGLARAISSVDTNTLTTQIANYSVASTDCGKTIQAGTGSTGNFTLTLPAVSGFPATCSILIINGDSTAIKTLSGFPTQIGTVLCQQGTLGVKIVNGAWAVFYNPIRCGSTVDGTMTAPTFNIAVVGDAHISYSFQQGQWYRNGNWVTCSVDIVLQNFTHTTSTGAVGITGCPFITDDDYEMPLNYQGINKSGAPVVFCASSSGGTGCSLEASGSGSYGTGGTVNVTDMPSGNTFVVLRGTMNYRTSDP